MVRGGLDDTTACVDKTVLSCAQGKGFTEGTPTANDASCNDCVAGEYSDGQREREVKGVMGGE